MASLCFICAAAWLLTYCCRDRSWQQRVCGLVAGVLTGVVFGMAAAALFVP